MSWALSKGEFCSVPLKVKDVSDKIRTTLQNATLLVSFHKGKGTDLALTLS